MKLSSTDRGQQTIFLLFQDPEMGATFRSALAFEGYECFIFIDQEIFFDRIKESPPNLVIFELDALMGTLSEFAQAVLEINPEVHFLPVVEAPAANALIPYRDYNFIGLFIPGADAALRLLWQVDSHFSEIILQQRLQKAEQIADESQSLIAQAKQQLSEIQSKAATEIAQAQTQAATSAAAATKSGWSAIEAEQVYRKCSSREEMMGRFLERTISHAVSPKKSSGSVGLYFKYMSSMFNLVATQGHGISLEKLKGIGVKLTPAEADAFPELARKNQAPVPLQELLHQGFHANDYFLRPLLTYRGIEGILVFWNATDFDSRILDNEWMVFSYVYQLTDMRLKFDEVNVLDPVTEAYNRDFYLKNLEMEVSRARRLQKPVSVIKLSFDQWNEMKAKTGDLVRDSILKSLVAIIKKTGRTNDFCCLTKDGELTLILPHSGRQGAAVRAERLRRIVEAQTFQYVDGPLTISSGVSEYPSFCSSAVELDHTAAQAMAYIQSRGGNKLCLYKPMDKFKPDFEVPPM